MMRWWLLGLLALAACSDDDVIRGNNAANNSNNSATNNSGSNNATNNVVGVSCTDNDDCTPPANSCQGDVAVVYSGNGLCGSETGICNFFFVTERVDCTVTVQSCQDGACVDNACTRKVCDTPNDFCEGSVAVFYQRASACDVGTGDCVDNEARVDCATSNTECVAGTCVGVCAGVSCDNPPAARCEGDTLVTPGNGVCSPQTGECGYTESTTDCAAMDMVCSNGACRTPVDLCANVTCNAPPAASCMGNAARTYAPGTCDPADGMCDYAPTTTDCSLTNTVCVLGACEDLSANAGDLMVVEIMSDPEAVDDTNGEWFEVINVSNRNVNIAGLTLESANDQPYTLSAAAPAVVAAGERVVFGLNADAGTNGGVGVDHTYAGLALDAVDSITLKVGSTEIDTVAWDANYPVEAGKAMGLGGQHDPVAQTNDDGALWCVATTALGTDFGTPGAANDTCP